MLMAGVSWQVRLADEESQPEMDASAMEMPEEYWGYSSAVIIDVPESKRGGCHEARSMEADF